MKKAFTDGIDLMVTLVLKLKPPHQTAWAFWSQGREKNGVRLERRAIHWTPVSSFIHRQHDYVVTSDVHCTAITKQHDQFTTFTDSSLVYVKYGLPRQKPHGE